jgi:glycosyltransferase involved in cell wall biosynthesis
MKTASGACLGVIMPVYNECRTVALILERVLAQPAVAEVIVVDDGSTDGTWDCLMDWQRKDPRVELRRHSANMGKGAAIRTGCAVVRAPVVVIQDGDLEYDPADFASLLRPILEGQADVVYGSRFAQGCRTVTHTWHRLGNQALTLVSNLATNLWLSDEATCYKMFRRDLLTRISLEEDDFGFCPEFTAKISKLKVPVCEVPVSYRARTRADGKKIRWRDGAKALWYILKHNFLRRHPHKPKVVGPSAAR